MLKFNVFGHLVVVTASDNGWAVFHVGAEGKRRPAKDILVPSNVPPAEVERYLDDLCHEWATEHHPKVERLD